MSVLSEAVKSSPPEPHSNSGCAIGKYRATLDEEDQALLDEVLRSNHLHVHVASILNSPGISLGVSSGTVSRHRSALKKKDGLPTRSVQCRCVDAGLQ